MRVLLLAQFFPPDVGGEERHVFNLANALAERGHEVAVASQRMAGVPDRETLASGVRVHRFATAAMRLPGVYSTSRTHHPPLPDPLGVRALSRITRQERPQVVHAHNWIVNSALPLRLSPSPGPRFGLVLTLHDFSHVCATKRLMRMGSACEGPAVARCLPCASAHYGTAVGSVTAAATALMHPWKKRAVDHVVCVSNAVASGNHIPAGPDVSVIPNFVPDEVVLGRAGAAAQGRGDDMPPGLPRGASSCSSASCPATRACRRCCGRMSHSAGNARRCCWSAGACQTPRPAFPTVPGRARGGHTITSWPRSAVAVPPCFLRSAWMPVRPPCWRRWPAAVRWSPRRPAASST